MVLAVVGLALGGCAQGGEEAERSVKKVATGAEAKGVAEWFPFAVGGKTLRVQLVVTTDEMQRGLMGRRDLGADEGMIFVYPSPTQMNFWMHNTPTSLDIGFFKGDGTLGEVYPLFAYDETPVKSQGVDYMLALEVNQGWFSRQALKPGARADLRQLAAALRARGFQPARYGVLAE